MHFFILLFPLLFFETHCRKKLPILTHPLNEIERKKEVETKRGWIPVNYVNKIGVFYHFASHEKKEKKHACYIFIKENRKEFEKSWRFSSNKVRKGREGLKGAGVDAGKRRGKGKSKGNWAGIGWKLIPDEKNELDETIRDNGDGFSIGEMKRKGNQEKSAKEKRDKEITYRYVEDMELKKCVINGTEIEYREYNLENGVYLVDEENYERVKKLWDSNDLKKAKENFEGEFDIKSQGLKDDDWIIFPLDYEENKNIKLIKADFDNPMYDYILTYYDKERNYYWQYKRRNFYKRFKGTIHEVPPYKSEREEDKRFYGKEIIIPKKKLDDGIFRQPMLTDVLTGGYSREPIGIESWRFVKYPLGNLIEPQKFSRLYCIKKNEEKKPDMKYYYLGNSNLSVSEVGLGTMNFGNYVDEETAHSLFNYAFEEFQVNFFDTAEIYPLPVSENLYGVSEEILGKWVASKGKANRHKFVISTKVCGRTDKLPWLKKYKQFSGLANNETDTSNSAKKILDHLKRLRREEERLQKQKDLKEMGKPVPEMRGTTEEKDVQTGEEIVERQLDIPVNRENIITSVEQSLKRLRTDYIDLLQIHWPDRYYPNQSSGDYSDVLFDYNKYYDDYVPFIEQLEAINELKKKGKIREWGLSNETPFGVLQFYDLCKSLHISPPVSIQLEYNLLSRNDVEKGFVEIARPQNTNISILAYAPLAAGILTGKYLEYTDYTTKGRMQKFPSYMKRLRGSLATYIIRELYYISQRYYFPNLTVAALKWVYTRPFITSTIIGVSDFLQLRENLYSLTDECLFTDKLEREINALHWKFRDPIRIIQ